MNLSDLVVSQIRTYTPAVAGALIGWGVSLGLPVSAGMKDGLTAILIPVFAGAWYLGVRLLEKRYPWAGWLLGLPRTPTYQPPDPPPGA